MGRRVGLGQLARTGQVQSYFSSPRYTLTTDASPCGLGAWLAWDGVPVEWLESAITATDERILGVSIGSCSAQAAFEALAIVAALRAWASIWRNTKLAVMVRSDSKAALGALCKATSPAVAVNRVARELGVDVAWSRYGVEVWTHVPGKLNTWADILSRLHQPGAHVKVPGELAHIDGTVVQERTLGWWAASEPP